MRTQEAGAARVVGAGLSRGHAARHGRSGGTAAVYINGQLIGGMPITSTQAPLENLQDVILGQLAGANFLFQGLLDEVRI